MITHLEQLWYGMLFDALQQKMNWRMNKIDKTEEFQCEDFFISKIIFVEIVCGKKLLFS